MYRCIYFYIVYYICNGEATYAHKTKERKSIRITRIMIFHNILSPCICSIMVSMILNKLYIPSFWSWKFWLIYIYIYIYKRPSFSNASLNTSNQNYKVWKGFVCKGFDWKNFAVIFLNSSPITSYDLRHQFSKPLRLSVDLTYDGTGTLSFLGSKMWHPVPLGN